MKSLMRFLCLVLALSMLLFAFTACGDEEPSDTPSNEETPNGSGGNNDNLGDIPDNLDGDNVTDIEDLLGELN